LFLPEKDFFKMNITGIMFPKKQLLEEGGFVNLPTTWHVDQIAWACLGAKGFCIFEEQPLCSIRLHQRSITSCFERNMDGAIETNFKTKEIFDKILLRSASRAATPEDSEYLETARKNMNQYMKRHLSRCLDQGFINILDRRENHTATDINKLLHRMRELEVPVFSSSYVYRSLGVLPYQLRKPFLDAFKDFKVKKWCS